MRPAHDHHQEETEQQEQQATDAILDADHLVVGREDVFVNPGRLVMSVVVSVVVRVRVIVREWLRRS